jgi:hypothetical protein
MPSPSILGVSAIRWGADLVLVLASIEPGSIDQDNDQLIDEKALDANGNVISRILGDAHSTVRVTALYKGTSLPAAGTFVNIKYDQGGSVVNDPHYFCNGKSRRRYSNRGNLMVELELERHALIASS